jgi:DNA-binding MarR family transcriptional regulator
MTLDRESGRTMGALAQQWECDPANATWVIDRLERLGYAARRPSPTDRRAKLVVLTPQGATVKSAIAREFYTPPRALLALDTSQLEELRRVFDQLLADADPVRNGRRRGRK